MKWEATYLSDSVVINISGNVTRGTNERFLSIAIEEMAKKGIRTIIMNLENIQHMNFQGFGMFIYWNQLFSNHGGRLLLSKPNPQFTDFLFQMVSNPLHFILEEEKPILTLVQQEQALAA